MKVLVFFTKIDSMEPLKRIGVDKWCKWDKGVILLVSWWAGKAQLIREREGG